MSQKADRRQKQEAEAEAEAEAETKAERQMERSSHQASSQSRMLVLAAVGVAVVLSWWLGPQAVALDRSALEGVVAQLSSKPIAGWPLLVPQGEVWFQPLAVYPALVLTRIGLSLDWALRIPPLLAGLATLMSTVWLAVAIGMSMRVGILGAVLLLFAPGFLTSARTPGADLLMVALILVWLAIVLREASSPSTSVERAAVPDESPRWSLRESRRLALMVGGTALGLAAYTQPAGVLSVPVYLLVGLMMLRRRGDALRAVASAGLGVAIAGVPLGLWFLTRPETYPETVGRWAIHAAHIRDPLAGLEAVTRWAVLARRADALWDYFNPSFLFLSGELFGMVMIVLVPLGIWILLRSDSATKLRLLLAAFAGAAIAAALLDIPRDASLALVLLPLGALLAGHGVDAASPSRAPNRVVSPGTFTRQVSGHERKH